MVEPNEMVEDGWIAADLRCARCMTTLRNCRADGRCPGCGAAIAKSLEQQFVDQDLPLDGDGLIQRAVKCVACGFNLHGCAPNGTCPSCDADVARSLWYAPTDMVVLKDDDDRLIENVGCAQCGYNLRGMKADATCPECGADVAPSIDRALQLFREAGRLMTLSRGMTWLLAATVGWLLSFGTMFVGVSRLGCFFALAPLVVLVAGPTGLYMVCVPGEGDRLNALRRAVRVAVIVSLIGWGLWWFGAILLAIFGVAARTNTTMTIFFMSYLGIIPSVTTLFAIGGGIFVLSRSLGLVRGNAMQRQIRIVGWGTLAMSGFSLATTLAVWVDPGIGMVGNTFVILCMTVLLVWLVPLLLWFRRQTRALAKAAIAGRFE